MVERGTESVSVTVQVASRGNDVGSHRSRRAWTRRTATTPSLRAEGSSMDLLRVLGRIPQTTVYTV